MDISIIPESAPFNPEQRAWLNGFLAGWTGIGGAMTAASALSSLPKPAPEPEPAAPEPWHDPAIPIDERLKLAEGEPLPRRLMAAMAQLDCGACGYLCRTYSEAIASGAEPRLTLCSPGDSETAKVVKRLAKEKPANGSVPAKTSSGADTNVKVHATNGTNVNGSSAGDSLVKYTRENPYTARIVKSVNLNLPGSEKETRHVEIDLGPDGPKYSVGDSLGVYPENCDALAEELITTLGKRGNEAVRLANGDETSLRIALLRNSCLNEVSENLLERMAEAARDPEDAARLRALIDDDGPIAGFDVLDLLRAFPSVKLLPEELVAGLSPIKPRLYSISSSPKAHAGQVHLTVRRVDYQFNGRVRKGAASTMFADRLGPSSPVRVFVQPSHGFSLPDDPDAATILIGPGTGIAPFRAFLHERDAVGAKGKNWLVFGDQRGEFDFLYQNELSDFLRRGVLTRLDTAFSRDQGGKVYVQDRLRENGAELFQWLESGAHFYVCGDAKRMAADVDRALRDVVRDHGRLGDDGAKAYLAKLASEGRYRKDVY